MKALICWVLFQTTRAVYFSSNVHYGRSIIFWGERRGLEISKKKKQRASEIVEMQMFFTLKANKSEVGSRKSEVGSRKSEVGIS